MLIDKNLSVIRRVFIPIFDIADEFLFSYMQKLINNTGARITLMDMAGDISSHPAITSSVKEIQASSPGYISMLNEIKIEKKFLQQFDLMVISAAGWKKLLVAQSLWLSNSPSNLILKA